MQISTTAPITPEEELRRFENDKPEHNRGNESEQGYQPKLMRLDSLFTPDFEAGIQFQLNPVQADEASLIQLVAFEDEGAANPDDSRDDSPAIIDGDDTFPEVRSDEYSAVPDFDFDRAIADEFAARPSVPLSLDEVRASALTSNLDLQVVRIEPAIAREQISVEEWAFEATFNSALQRNRIDPPPGNLTFGLPPETISDTWNNSINLPLYSGGTFSAETTMDRTDINLPGFDSVYDTSTGLTFAQPLLRNGGFNVTTAGIRIAQGESGIADARAKLAAINVLAEAERAYWLLFGVRKELEISEQQLQIAQEQLDNAQRLYDTGFVSKVEILRSESGLLLRRTSNITARTNVFLAERELKRIIQRPDLPVESPIGLLPGTLPNPLGLTFERHQLVSMAMANRMELLELQILYLNQSIGIDVASNAVLPRLDVRLNARNLNSDPNFRRAEDLDSTGNFYDWTAGLTADIPLAGNQSARAARRQAEFARLRTAISQERQRVVITQDVLDAVDQFEQNWQRIVNGHRSVAAAQDAFNAESRLFELRQRTSDLVLQSAANLAVAQTELIRAIVDYQISIVDLAVATGTMLGYSHLQWSDAPMRSHFNEGDIPPAPAAVAN